MSRFTVSAIVNVDLDDIEFDDILEYVEANGYKVIKRSPKAKEQDIPGLGSADAAYTSELSLIAEDIVDRKNEKDFMRRLLSEVLFGHRTATREEVLEHIGELL